MRSYAPYDRKKQGSDAGKKKERKVRSSTEWDIRIDVTTEYADEIVDRLRGGVGPATYVLVSGIEQPDNADVTWGSRGLHVHIALVSEYPLRRDQALALIRGPTPKTEEYAVPRNTKYTYAGWYLHHTKIDWKLVKEKTIRYEYGILPNDPTDEVTKKKIQTIFKKFGRDEPAHEELNKQKFINYLN